MNNFTIKKGNIRTNVPSNEHEHTLEIHRTPIKTKEKCCYEYYTCTSENCTAPSGTKFNKDGFRVNFPDEYTRTKHDFLVEGPNRFGYYDYTCKICGYYTKSKKYPYPY